MDPVDIYGPPAFVNSQKIGRFVDYWNGIRFVKHKQFDTQSFVPQVLHQLIDYVTANTSDNNFSPGIKSVEDKLQPHNSHSIYVKNLQYDYSQIVACIGQRRRTVFIIQNCLYDMVQFLKNAYAQLLNTSRMQI